MPREQEDPEPNAVQVTHPHPNITLITLNRPHRRNAVDTPTAHKLHKAFTTFEADASQKLGILTGGPDAFCAGFDLHTVNDTAPPPSSSSPPTTTSTSSPKNKASQPNEFLTTPAPMGPSRLALSKPLLAALSGPAVAGGLELSLLADLRLITPSTYFGVFCRRWGVPLIDGGTVRLQRLIGLSRALDLILTGRPVAAQEALQMGLANRVVPEGKDVVAEAVELGKRIVEFPELCMRLDRKSAYFAAYEAGSLEAALRFEYENGVEAVMREGRKGAERFSKGSGRHGVFGDGAGSSKL